MKIITVSVANHSLRFTLFNMDNEDVLCMGALERIGLDSSRFIIQYANERIIEQLEIPSYLDAIHTLFDKLVALSIISDVDSIGAVGFKILYGKDSFSDKEFLSDEILSQLEEFSDRETMNDTLAAIRGFREILPNVDVIGVFDNAFYHSLTEEAYLYAVPYQWYSNYGVRKYGFQGIHHQYISKQIHHILGKENISIISCFLGDEGSVSAIRNGKCIDTSMGFSPLTGVLMGTKSGDVDPSVIPYIMEKEGKNAGEVLDDLLHNSGLLGLSECSSDMRDIITLCEQNHPKALVAKNKYVRRIVDYIAQYYVLLQGVDAIVLSGSIGEDNVTIRREICEKLYSLGVKIDLDQNSICGEVVKISADDSTIPVYVIPSREELMIARSTLELKNR